MLPVGPHPVSFVRVRAHVHSVHWMLEDDKAEMDEKKDDEEDN